MARIKWPKFIGEDEEMDDDMERLKEFVDGLRTRVGDVFKGLKSDNKG